MRDKKNTQIHTMINDTAPREMGKMALRWGTMKMTTTTTMGIFVRFLTMRRVRHDPFLFLSTREVYTYVTYGWKVHKALKFYLRWLMCNDMGQWKILAISIVNVIHKRLIFTYLDTFSHLQRGRKQ